MSLTSAAEDRLAIRNLVETYADAVFRRDAESWIACWSREPTWNLAGTVIEGRETVLGAWQQAMAGFAFVAFFSQIGRIEVSGDDASLRLYTHEFLEKQDGERQRVLGQYDDKLVREDGAWRFATRTFTINKEWPA
ncbi:nuclear transport factor 2 family protein [Erythrobacter sp.]|uniref:nuclear transport factor 2 family protein n=1 Tax=Erythrobacter sp. TaxID=1042 RepID=UPI002E9F6FE7|nr:nuclear transport factor 2 family protein [Erythrobacter sp.]